MAQAMISIAGVITFLLCLVACLLGRSSLVNAISWVRAINAGPIEELSKSPIAVARWMFFGSGTLPTHPASNETVSLNAKASFTRGPEERSLASSVRFLLIHVSTDTCQ